MNGIFTYEFTIEKSTIHVGYAIPMDPMDGEAERFWWFTWRKSRPPFISKTLGKTLSYRIPNVNKHF